MQNKPNLRNGKMSVTSVMTNRYDKIQLFSSGKNKPNTNPIQSQYKANQTQNKANTKPIQTQSNPNVWQTY